MRSVLARDLELGEAIVQVWALAVLVALVTGALHATLGQDFLTTLSGRMRIRTIARVLAISSLIRLLLNLCMELSKLDLTGIGLLLVLRLSDLVLQLLLLI